MKNSYEVRSTLKIKFIAFTVEHPHFMNMNQLGFLFYFVCSLLLHIQLISGVIRFIIRVTMTRGDEICHNSQLFHTLVVAKKNHSYNFRAKIQIFFLFYSSTFTWSTWMIRRKKKSLVIRKISFLFSSLYLKCLSFEPANAVCAVYTSIIKSTAANYSGWFSTRQSSLHNGYGTTETSVIARGTIAHKNIFFHSFHFFFCAAAALSKCEELETLKIDRKCCLWLSSLDHDRYSRLECS